MATSDAKEWWHRAEPRTVHDGDGRSFNCYCDLRSRKVWDCLAPMCPYHCEGVDPSIVERRIALAKDRYALDVKILGLQDKLLIEMPHRQRMIEADLHKELNRIAGLVQTERDYDG